MSVLTVMTVPFNQLTIEEVQFLLPGVLEMYFMNSTSLFNEIVNESIFMLDKSDDKSVYSLKQSYYHHLAEEIYNLIITEGLEPLFRKMMLTHTLVDLQIVGTSCDLFIRWMPK